jgi:transposase InsO family protein
MYPPDGDPYGAARTRFLIASALPAIERRRALELARAARSLLKSHDITPSMSRKGDCWDNVVAESFFSSFGFELEFDANWRDVHDVEDRSTLGALAEAVARERRSGAWVAIVEGAV